MQHDTDKARWPSQEAVTTQPAGGGRGATPSCVPGGGENNLAIEFFLLAAPAPCQVFLSGLSCFICTSTLRRGCYSYPFFTDGETEAQKVTCPRSQGW